MTVDSEWATHRQVFVTLSLYCNWQRWNPTMMAVLHPLRRWRPHPTKGTQRQWKPSFPACPPSLFSLQFNMARAAYRAITVRKQTYKTERGVWGLREVKINIPGAAKSRLSRALFPSFRAPPPAPWGPPLRSSTPLPLALFSNSPSPLLLLHSPVGPPPLLPHYKTFNLNVKLKRNGFSSRPREWDLDFKFHFNRAVNVSDYGCVEDTAFTLRHNYTVNDANHSGKVILFVESLVAGSVSLLTIFHINTLLVDVDRNSSCHLVAFW